LFVTHIFRFELSSLALYLAYFFNFRKRSTEALRQIGQAAAEGWTELNLAGLKLEELPVTIDQWTQLQPNSTKLNLSKNLIRELPKEHGSRLTFDGLALAGDEPHLLWGLTECVEGGGVKRRHIIGVNAGRVRSRFHRSL
jgi:hypothetical protein